MKKPLVSVIVSCYKGADSLPSCLNALLHQTLKNIEIICINDGSPDQTAEVLRDFSKRDSRIIPINNKQNIGISASRNKGIKKASSDFIMFCDADDYYEPEMCKLMYEAICSNDADVAISEIRVIYNAHEEMRFSDSNYYSLKYSGLQEMQEDKILNTDLSPTNKIFRKSIIDKFGIQFPEGLYYEDAFFCSAYFCCCKNIYYLNEQLYNYIRHEKSTMSNTWSNTKKKDPAIDHLYIAFRLYDFLKHNDLLSRYNTLFWKLFLSFEYFSLTNSKSMSRKRKVRLEAKSFIVSNEASFRQAPRSVQKEIRTANSSVLRPIIAKSKRVVLRFMPTYNFQSVNLLRLKKLDNNYSQLLSRVSKLK